MTRPGLLRRTRDYDEVYRQGRRRRSPHFLVIAHRTGGKELRFGISVQKRLGGAVVRNRIRRRIRDVIRQGDWLAREGCDIVVQPRSATVARCEFAAMREELGKLIRSTVETVSGGEVGKA